MKWKQFLQPMTLNMTVQTNTTDISVFSKCHKLNVKNQGTHIHEERQTQYSTTQQHEALEL